MPLKDSFNRVIDYVRVSVTDRCNLRCFYCMPEQGIIYEPKAHLLSYEDIVRLLQVLGELGFKKVRFTGGEPFLRKDFMTLVEHTAKLGHYRDIRITTNGTLIQRHIPKLKELGIDQLNLSLDTLNAERFKRITRRDTFAEVINTLHLLIKEGFKVKINAVVMYDVNTEDIIPLVNFAKEYPVNIRFIEEMPFNGGYKKNDRIFKATEIYETIQKEHPVMVRKSRKHGDTATEYAIEGFRGDISIIPAFSRTFCNTCNRLRITSKGEIKTCLYDSGVFSMRDFIRSGVSDKALADKFKELIRLKPENGFVAEAGTREKLVRAESMSSIGG